MNTVSSFVSTTAIAASLIAPAGALGAPNLTPYQPTGWSDKIVVSRTTGTTTDSPKLTTADTLYVDWAIINNGGAPTTSTFDTALYVDGALQTDWYSDPPVNPGTWQYIKDYSIGSLSSGTHRITITADYTHVIQESNETDNSYTKTIIVGNPPLPNLRPYQPPGWSDKIVVSNKTGTTIDTTNLTVADTLYVDWAVINDGDAAATSTFDTALYVDGTFQTYWYTDPPVNPTKWQCVKDYSLGSLRAGTHTITVTVDYTGTIWESNEADNSYTKAVQVGPVSVGGGNSVLFNVTLDGAHEFWTDYPTVVLYVGDRVVFDATGRILWDAGTSEPYVGPDGASWTPSQVSDPEQFQLPNFAIAGLIGNIGGSVFGIGSHKDLTVTANGTLELGINERWVSGCWSDDSGTFEVSIRVDRLNVDPSASSVTVRPSTTPADGLSPVAVTVTLRDANGQPVQGKVVKVSALGTTMGVSISQPSGATDDNGQATATVTSTTAGTVLIAATDATDGLALSGQGQEPAVTFTANLVAPSAQLSQAISAAADSAASCLSQGDDPIAQIAVDEGAEGDDFWEKVKSSAAQVVVDTLFFAGGTAAEAALPKELTVLQHFVVWAGETKDNALAWQAVQAFMEGMAGRPNRLGNVGSGLAAASRQDQVALAAQAQELQAGVPQASLGLAAGFGAALTSRNEANHVLLRVLQAQDGALQAMRKGIETGNGYMEGAADASTLLELTAVFLPPPVDLVVGLAGLDVDILKQDASQREALGGYQSAWSSLVSCAQIESSIYENSAETFREISQGLRPDIPSGMVSIGPVVFVPPRELSVPSPWAMAIAGSTPALIDPVTSAYTEVQVQNTGPDAANFEAVAFFHTASAPQVGLVVGAPGLHLEAGEKAPLVVTYYDRQHGAIPAAGSAIEIDVLGWNSAGGYYVGGGNSPVPLVVSGVPHAPGGGVRPMGGSDTSAVVIANPLGCEIARNPTNQSYEAVFETQNPFSLTLQATITQPLPPGLTVLATDGTVTSGAVVWTETIPSNGIALSSLSFTLPATPGAQTNLPAPSVVFREPATTNQLGLESLATSFSGLFPVGLSSSIPLGTPGTNVTMTVKLTNLTAAGQTGLLTLTMTNATLPWGTNFTQSFTVAAAGATNLAFGLPGTIPPGQYPLSVTLSMNGGSGQVLAGVYTMPPPLITLALGPAPAWSSNGLSLALQGPLGSNYLIQASSDLVNWTPFRFFGITNSPFFFNDISATNFTARFYRAMLQ